MGRLPTQVAHTRNSVMRTSRRTIFAFVLGAIPLAPAFGFDGTPVNSPAKTAAPLGIVAGPPAAEAFSRAAMKLPIKTKVVARLGDTSHLGGDN